MHICQLEIMQQHVYAIAQACESAGIQQAIICPGSRSAPLVYAFTQSNIQCHSIVDERSAAYIALGMAQQSAIPVVLICTSGTAALNFFPAVAEAFYQHIPLLVITADRPPELMNQQDGQMIMQKEVYGKHVKGSFELPCYEPGKENLPETAKLVQLALQMSIQGAKGPVHINVPLIEPLYPTGAIAKKSTGNILPFIPEQTLATKSSEQTSLLWKKAKRKMILVGQMPCDAKLTAALLELKNQPDVVIVCDVLSNQYQYNTASHFDYLLMRADAKTLKELEPDLIVSFGGPVLSKALKKWLQQCKPAVHIRYNVGEQKVDTYQNVTHTVDGNAAVDLFDIALLSSTQKEDSRYKLFWQETNKIIAHTVQHYAAQPIWSELHVMNTVLNLIPDAANVQIGNSSIIRYVSYLGKINASWVVNGNRGTSGIDGCTSTAVGASLVNNRPTFLLTGDIAFLYDNNALWNNLPPNLKIVVFNNNGGGIFQLIDGPNKHKGQLAYFTTPHKQNIGAWAMAKNIKHHKVNTQKEFLTVAKTFFEPSSFSSILELTVDRDQNSELFKRFKKQPF